MENKFKKGDKVRVNETCSFSWHHGKAARVQSAVEAGVLVIFEDGHTATLLPTSLDVYVPPATAKDDHGLNVGPRLASPLPTDSAERKQYPLTTGLLDYFPAALARVAHQSYMGNVKHSPETVNNLRWVRDKSSDHLDAAVRHIMERDLEGAAWRILAALQMQCEQEGAPVAPAAYYGTK